MNGRQDNVIPLPFIPLPIFCPGILPDTFSPSIPHVWADGKQKPKSNNIKTMKIQHLQLTLPIVCALCVAPGIHTAHAGETNSTNTVDAASEDLGYDFDEGKTNKIAKVYAVTPTHVYVMHEGGKSGRDILRQSLPHQLAIKYPHDAEKAGEYQKQKADIAAQQALTARAAMRENVRRQEQQLLSEIALEKQRAAKLDTDINLHKKQPKSIAKRATLQSLINQRQMVSSRLAQLQSQLNSLNARQASLP
jgi:hypothetical protein